MDQGGADQPVWATGYVGQAYDLRKLTLSLIQFHKID